MANVNDKAFDTMTAAADKTNVDIKKEGLYSDYAFKARGLRGKNKFLNKDGSHSTVRMRTEQNPKTGDWESFPTLFHDKKQKDWEGGWKEYGEDDIKGAYGEASSRGEVFNFGKDKEGALKFGEGSWKLPELLKER
jgi:hypothetical protein